MRKAPLLTAAIVLFSAWSAVYAQTFIVANEGRNESRIKASWKLASELFVALKN
jgi:hypothetical protein